VDFVRVLDTVIRFLDDRGFRYALVGAFALSAYGLSRATQDLDLVVDAAARRDLVSLFESLGYETLYSAEGYSNHLHSLPRLGRVDCIYVAEPTATRLFQSATAAPLLGRTLRVPKPEHLAAMKVLAMKNDPNRTFERWPIFSLSSACLESMSQKTANSSNGMAFWRDLMKSVRSSTPLDLEAGLLTRPDDVQALRQASGGTAISLQEYLAFLRQFEDTPAAVLRARRGPRGERLFEL
jgi:hypothetical protein